MSVCSHLLCKPQMIKLHTKCRDSGIEYINSTVKRILVPDDKVNWNVPWPSYSPVEYTDQSTYGKPWSDEDITSDSLFKWNSLDGQVNRKSHQCSYSFDCDHRPLNPLGRTGMRGRGILGRWGPNHAADPVVTRRSNGTLQFVAIQRGDTGEWAIPGGMVDAGELVSKTLIREFSEEALGGKVQASLDDLWKNGKELYRGYVDDHRNTDNAWMETVVMNFHDETGLLANVDLEAGDDAVKVRWIDINGEEPLYASHQDFIKLLRNHHSIS